MKGRYGRKVVLIRGQWGWGSRGGLRDLGGGVSRYHKIDLLPRTGLSHYHILTCMVPSTSFSLAIDLSEQPALMFFQ